MTSDSDSLALCLSGGGLRATLFHLGVIKALRCYRRGEVSALESVSEIYSVSGGSLLAAHLLRYWRKYTGSAADFAEVERDLLAFARRNIRDRVIRRWLLFRPTGRRRGDWLQSEYRSLVGSCTLDECYASIPQADGSPSRPPPTLYILATSFKTGELCAFTPQDFEIVRRRGGRTQVIATPADRLELVYAMAASSAFPPMFPPIKLTADMLGNPETDEFLVPTYLSDGGVFDNLGFEKFSMRVDRKGRPPGTVIVSNAGGSFRTEAGATYSGIFSRNVRASDILMRRVAESTEDAAGKLRRRGIDYIPIRIGMTVDDGSLPEVTQQRLRSVRTDLDRFDSDLSLMLIDHGFRVAAAALRAAGWTPDAALPPFLSPNRRRLDLVAAKAARRRPWSVLFGFGDWATAALWLLALIPLVAIGAMGYRTYQTRALEAEQTADEQLAGDRGREKDIYADRLMRQLRDENRRLAQQLAARGLEVDPLVPPAAPVENVNRRDYKVWIQFAGFTRGEMTEFGAKVADRWPGAQGADRGGERTANARGQREVRHNPVDRKAAEELTRDIVATGLVREMNSPRALGIIPPGSLEIWVSR